MPDRTPAEQGGDADLARAVAEAAARMAGHDVLVVDFLVVYAGVDPTDNPGDTHYGVCYPDGELPLYRSLGLLQMAKDMVRADLDDEGDPE